MEKKYDSKVMERPIGLVGLGLMGQGIATGFLAHGFKVIAYNRTASRAKASIAHVGSSLKEMVRRKLTTAARIRDWRERYQLVTGLEGLAACGLIVETIKEDLELKREIYGKLEDVLSDMAIISSNTSSIPITLLQHGWKHPERFIGMHWASPSRSCGTSKSRRASRRLRKPSAAPSWSAKLAEKNLRY